MNKKNHEVMKLLEMLGELTAWYLPDMTQFLMEGREDWGGLSAQQMVEAGKINAVIRCLERLRN